MNSYTVKEIADMLKTNPETVRRWIRLGKLKAEQSTRKGGNVISEQNLNNFLKTTPKYAGIAAGTVGLLGIAGLPVLTATLLGTMIAHKNIADDLLRNSQVSVSEILKFITTSIKSSEKTISAKKEEIEKLEMEVKAENKHIEELKSLYMKLKNSSN